MLLGSPEARRSQKAERRVWRQQGAAGFDGVCRYQTIKRIIMTLWQLSRSIDHTLVERQILKLETKRFLPREITMVSPWIKSCNKADKWGFASWVVTNFMEANNPQG